MLKNSEQTAAKYISRIRLLYCRVQYSTVQRLVWGATKTNLTRGREINSPGVRYIPLLPPLYNSICMSKDERVVTGHPETLQYSGISLQLSGGGWRRPPVRCKFWGLLNCPARQVLMQPIDLQSQSQAHRYACQLFYINSHVKLFLPAYVDLSFNVSWFVVKLDGLACNPPKKFQKKT